MSSALPMARSFSAFGWAMRPCSRLSTVAASTPAAAATPRMDIALAVRRLVRSAASLFRWDGVMGSAPVSTFYYRAVVEQTQRFDAHSTTHLGHRPFIGVEDKAASALRRVIDPEFAGRFEIAQHGLPIEAQVGP